jgi:hypothetical protein
MNAAFYSEQAVSSNPQGQIQAVTLHVRPATALLWLFEGRTPYSLVKATLGLVSQSTCTSVLGVIDAFYIIHVKSGMLRGASDRRSTFEKVKCSPQTGVLDCHLDDAGGAWGYELIK